MTRAEKEYVAQLIRDKVRPQSAADMDRVDAALRMLER